MPISGPGFIVSRSNVPLLVGVIHGTYGATGRGKVPKLTCADPTGYDVLANVTQVLSWIRNSMGKIIIIRTYPFPPLTFLYASIGSFYTMMIYTNLD